MAQQFVKVGPAFFRQDDSGQLYAVGDRDTLNGLKTGQLGYSSSPSTRGLTFGNPSSLQAGTPSEPAQGAPQGETSTGTQDFASLLKSKLTSALTNYQGVTNTADMEVKRQALLRKQLLSPSYSKQGESTLTGEQKLSLMRGKGSQFEPEITALEEQIAQAKQGDENSLNSLAKLMSLAKDAGILGGEGGYQSGLGKEYADYVANEKSLGNTNIMSLNEYANMDANRKRSVTNSVDMSGMTPKQVAIFNSTVDKYNKSPLVAAKDRTIVVNTVSEQLKKDPKNASLQLSFIYSFIQMLDTYQSAVREGEIGIMSGTQGLGDKLSVIPDKIAQGTILSDDVINRYIATANMLSGSIKAGADLKTKQFGEQARVSGIGDSWNDYISSLGGSSSSPQQETKVLNGVTYVKVNGGWQKQ